MVGEWGRRLAAARTVGALAVLALLAGCSGSDAASPTVDETLVPTECVARTPVLRVDLIQQAVGLVEADMGGPQQYFEINATDLLVNLFVAIDGGTQVKPYVFLQGELNSTDPKTAEGNTFAASALDFDPQKVTSCVADQLPASTASAFEIIAGPEGAISYSLVVDSPEGGQLVVAVAADGTILSVDPV